MTLGTVDLTQVDPARLRAAVSATIERRTSGAHSRLPSSDHLKTAAAAALEDSETPSDEAKYFQSILEIGYLVASADGFAEEERKALAELLERATGSVVDQAALQLHFKDLDEGCQMLGRRERLRRAAAEFESPAGRAEALGFAALVAVADGQLAEPEVAALRDLGAHLELSDAQVSDVVDEVVQTIRDALGC